MLHLFGPFCIFWCLVQQKIMVNENYFWRFSQFELLILARMFVRIRHRWPLKFVGSPNQLSKVPEFWDLAALAIFWSLSLEFSTVAKFRPPSPDYGNCAIFR
jgi:hypothetical protein